MIIVSVPYLGLIFYFSIVNIIHLQLLSFRPLLGAYFLFRDCCHNGRSTSGFRPLLGAYFLLIGGENIAQN